MKFAPTLCASVLCVVLPNFAADAAADANLRKKADQIQTRILAFDSHLDLPFDYAGAAEDVSQLTTRASGAKLKRRENRQSYNRAA